MRTAWHRELASLAKAVLLSLACFCWLTWPALARAEGGPPKTVVMVVDPSALPLALRLRQEIESLGLVVKWLPRHQPPSSLEQEATTADAVASIRIAPMGGSDVDMTIFDRVTGQTVSWKLVAASTADPAAGELIATR